MSRYDRVENTRTKVDSPSFRDPVFLHTNLLEFIGTFLHGRIPFARPVRYGEKRPPARTQTIEFTRVVSESLRNFYLPSLSFFFKTCAPMNLRKTVRKRTKKTRTNTRQEERTTTRYSKLLRNMFDRPAAGAPWSVFFATNGRCSSVWHRKTIGLARSERECPTPDATRTAHDYCPTTKRLVLRMRFERSIIILFAKRNNAWRHCCGARARTFTLFRCTCCTWSTTAPVVSWFSWTRPRRTQIAYGLLCRVHCATLEAGRVNNVF